LAQDAAGREEASRWPPIFSLDIWASKNNQLLVKTGLGAVMTLWPAAIAGCFARRERKLLPTFSNMDLQNTGLNNYADVYMIKVRQINIK
jgi:hypothetical protein